MTVPVHFNEDTDEIVVGFVPKRDGSDYDEDMPSPSIKQLLRVMEDYYINGNQRIVLKIIGRMYKGQSKISGIGAPTDFNSVYDVSKSGKPYRQQVKDLVDATMDIQHVTAFVVQVL